ncbi:MULTISPECIES: DUF397 domain-containing protein [Nocardiopsis]|uniref:DUF397 domain-containing protein n=1 Tax=Nocardiopsis TaxID=2013 RepID=UPI000560BE17|nr:DUF397 domain-containing protein [Nocardiopsis dassonvillei]
MDTESLHWFKSSHSSFADSCVEAAFDRPGNCVRVRDSLAPTAGSLAVGQGEWSVLVRSLCAGSGAIEA